MYLVWIVGGNARPSAQRPIDNKISELVSACWLWIRFRFILENHHFRQMEISRYISRTASERISQHFSFFSVIQ